ncbi:MAG: lamin tail domain-containing protein [Minisyncoccia bacterium]
MFKKRFLIILFLLILPFKLLAYDNLTTHPALTSEIVKFYNNFAQFRINEQEKQWLIEGSIKEDDPLARTLNHFYDPIYQRGLSGEINAGALTPFLTILKPLILTAKDWAQNSYAQATFLGEAYRNAALNPVAQLTKSAVDILAVHTWEKAVYNYILGNKKEAFIDLGHVLHLLEDMAVPAHTRNDHHLTGDGYEKYAAQFTPENIDVASQLKNKKPLVFNNLNDYFNDLAFYTNTHFYSQDTIGVQSGYKQPEWNYLEVEKKEIYWYSINEDDMGKYFLVKKAGAGSVFLALSQNITIDDPLIYSDYWSHLSKKAVLSGAGVLNLFFQEVEKYKNDQNFLSRMRKTLIATTIENIKRALGLMDEEKKQEVAIESTPSALPLAINQSQTIEQSHEVSILPSATPLLELSQEIIFSPSPSLTPTLSPSPTPSSTPFLTPSPLPSFSPTPSTNLTPLITPTPSSTPEIYYSGSTSSTPAPTPTPTPIVYCATSTTIISDNPKVIINEIAWMGTSHSSADEWIELKNISTETINLKNWQLLDQDGQIKIIFPEKILAPNEPLLLERTNDEAVPNIAADLIFTGSINDTNESLKLFDSNCNLIDEAKTDENGNWPAGDKITKRSMERGDDLNWHTYSGEENNGILGTPKSENSPVVLTLPDTTPNPQKPKILISEILYDAKGTDVGKEFIELYNPNDIDINLIDWSLQLAKDNSTTTTSLLKIGKNDLNIIKAHGFLLIGFNSYDALNYNNVQADILRLSYSLPNPTLDNSYHIFLIDNEKNIIDEISYSKNSCPEGSSLERKAEEDSTVESMTIGMDQFMGNGYDSDSMTDFIVRDPQPQNSLSLPEPRQALEVSNLKYIFDNAGQIRLSFSILPAEQLLTFSDLEVYYSLLEEDLKNFSVSNITKAEILNKNFDFQNNNFEITLNPYSAEEYYVGIVLKDKDGMKKEKPAIIKIVQPKEIVISEPVNFYLFTNSSDYSDFQLANNYGLGNFSIIFTADESGYLKNVVAAAKSLNCALSVKVKIFEMENDNQKELGVSRNAVELKSYWTPGYFSWEFVDGAIVLRKNHQYLAQFYIDNAPNGNCWAYFPGESREVWGSDKTIFSFTGYKNRIAELSQKVTGDDLLEGETIYNPEVSFSARVFNYTDWPVKLQIEVRPRNEDFDNNIAQNDPHLFESNFVYSGDVATVLVSNLEDNAYHWRARAIDLAGYTSEWYYFGDKNNSDFYVDAEQSDYPENVLYSLDPKNVIETNAVEWASTMYGPRVIFSSFIANKSGYVDRIELPAYYHYCAFPIKAQIYAISPNQVNGNLGPLLGNSIDPAITYSWDGYFGILSWRFDQPVYLEKNHYYALKLDFSEVDTNTANCSVNYKVHPDIMGSKIYLPNGNGWQLKNDNDLNLVVYKKESE